MRTHLGMFVVAMMAWAFLAPPVLAQDPIHKMGRGLVNVVTGWIEIPKQVDLGRHKGNPITGILSGFFRGGTLALLRTGIGVYETLTFLMGYPNDFGSPYKGMELPDYAWE